MSKCLYIMSIFKLGFSLSIWILCAVLMGAFHIMSSKHKFDADKDCPFKASEGRSDTIHALGFGPAYPVKD